jgi:hypothetical protein
VRNWFRAALVGATVILAPAAKATTPVQSWEVDCRTVLASDITAGGQCWFRVDISGDIDASALTLLDQSLAYKHAVEAALSTKLALSVTIDSPGGSVPIAMTIGRKLRGEQATVKVKNKCMSACIFVLIGGVERQIVGKVGIHRSFLNPDPKSGARVPDSAEIKTVAEKQLAAMAGYVEEMNVPRKIVDDMMSIPSDSIRLLTNDDLFHYGILPLDPYEREARELKEAQRLGISHAEYLGRKALVRRTCYPGRSDNPYLENYFDKFDACYQRIMGERP